MIRVGLIGYGYWGPNLARNVYRSPACSLARVADFSPARLEAARRDCPGVDVAADPEAVLHASDIDAVIIATPVHTHYELALDALRHEKHVLVEKPMADSVRHSETLIAEASRRRLTLMVDHTFIYTPAVEWMRDYVQSGQLGDLFYFDSVRTNLGLFQRDVSVVWDLAPHDLSILWEVTKRPVRSVSATGSCHAGSRVPDIAYLSLDLGEGAMAHFHVNWLSPVKVRQITLAGSKRMVAYDDMQTSEKIKVYDSGVMIEHQDEAGQHRMRVDYRAGDMMSPALTHREALQAEIEHFAKCIKGEEMPRAGGEAGLQVVRILEAAEQSLQRGGEQIAL